MSTHPSGTTASHGSLKQYSLGFALSIILTLFAYIVGTGQSGYAASTLMWVVSGLAILQLVVQLIFFLHLGKESGPKWNLAAFSFAALIVVILAGGSIWVMNHLNANMSPEEMNSYMSNQDGL
jgi:cytochrome o ubiquinol oxidase subunit IV